MAKQSGNPSRCDHCIGILHEEIFAASFGGRLVRSCGEAFVCQVGRDAAVEASAIAVLAAANVTLGGVAR